MPDTSIAAVTPIPEHLHTITPRLVLPDVAAAIDFYAAAFGAEQLGERWTLPDGSIVHAEVRIGDSVVMLTEGDGQPRPGPALLCAYWADVDAAWERALAAGADVLYPLGDQPYGERGGRLADPWGHQWMMSMRTAIVTPAEFDAAMGS
jgi:uncharacterized glyoxalase superfamily protein PhnB